MSEDKSIGILASENDFEMLTIQGKDFKIGKIKPIYYIRILKIIGCIFRKSIKQIQDLGDEWGKMTEMEAIISFLSLTYWLTLF